MSAGKECQNYHDCDTQIEKNARIITTATPKFAKMISSKYADMGGARVQNDLESNHSRKVSKSHIQKIYDVVGSVASAK